jgi:hypothetical protein
LYNFDVQSTNSDDDDYEPEKTTKKIQYKKVERPIITSTFSRLSCSVCSKVLTTPRICAIHEVARCKVEWSTESLAELGINFQPCTIPGCYKKYPSISSLQR